MLEARRHPKPLRGRVVKVCPSVSYAAWAELKGEVQWAQRRASIGTSILHSGHFLGVGSAGAGAFRIDRESTRLNSSHSQNSYAGFFFEKKKRRTWFHS